MKIFKKFKPFKKIRNFKERLAELIDIAEDYKQLDKDYYVLVQENEKLRKKVKSIETDKEKAQKYEELHERIVEQVLLEGPYYSVSYLINKTKEIVEDVSGKPTPTISKYDYDNNLEKSI